MRVGAELEERADAGAGVVCGTGVCEGAGVAGRTGAGEAEGVFPGGAVKAISA